MTPAIRVENLSKQFQIGALERHTTLREAISGLFTSPLRRLRHLSGSHEQEDTIWALKDISFEVQSGEVVGIVGRNGAGKSTLLKILSQITEPTSGRALMNGRVGSLLEVGTGFHPELTGRENIFLNGAILGMGRREIGRKFDEIVAFAEIEKFLDTPVKRYSSGMHMRLAFAVAAHLEPEILIVDEVLAVGDAEFQKKCLGKMNDVAHHGRTVLFVSHNMSAVSSLCSRAILLAGGKICLDGDASEIINAYVAPSREILNEMRWSEASAPGNDEFKLMAVKVTTAGEPVAGKMQSNADVVVDMEFYAKTNHPSLCVGFDLQSGDGITVLRSYHTDASPETKPTVRWGMNRWTCSIPRCLLNSGSYYICPRIGYHNIGWITHLDSVVRFDVALNHGFSPLWTAINHGARAGLVAPLLKWSEAPTAENSQNGHGADLISCGSREV